jgi:threonine aldolase
MRQAGVLAAAGLIALEEMPKRLGEDHKNARFLADALSQIPGIRVPHNVQTNIVIFDVGGAGLTTSEFSARLKSRGVLINGINPTQMRLLTHYDADRAACERALTVIEEVARAAVAAKV